jgi:hypothetical protein
MLLCFLKFIMQEGGVIMQKRPNRIAVLAVFVVGIVMWTLSGSTEVTAQGGLQQHIQGTWTLVSDVNEQDGKKIDVFGPNPRGLFILTPEGRFTMVLLRASVPAIASKNRMTGTAEENKAIVQGTLAYYGKYMVVNEKENIVNLTFEGSTFPNFDGQTQKRIMTPVGDELKVVNPTSTLGSGTTYLIWKRLK